MYYVYILLNKKDNKFYAGFTHDLKRRLSEHKQGKVYTTYRYNEFELIFYEAFTEENDARKRERYFKTTKGKKALKIILRESIK